MVAGFTLMPMRECCLNFELTVVFFREIAGIAVARGRLSMNGTKGLVQTIRLRRDNDMWSTQGARERDR